jgi:hypothetical protein
MADRTGRTRTAPRKVSELGPAPAKARLPQVTTPPAEAQNITETAEAAVTRYARENQRLTQQIAELRVDRSRRSEALQAALQAAAGRRIRWGKLPVRITQAAAEFERFLTAG